MKRIVRLVKFCPWPGYILHECVFFYDIFVTCSRKIGSQSQLTPHVLDAVL